MKTKRTFILGLGLLLAVQSDAALPVSLDQLIEKGLQQNFQLRIARNDQQLTDNNATPGNAGMLPVLDLNSTF